MTGSGQGMPGFDELRATTFTRTVHSDVYPAIDPSKPELSQAGKTVLIPGGGTGIGFAIATSFVRAGAERIIIISRRAKVLAAAAARLDEEAKGKTKIISKQCDVDKRNEVDALWKWFSDENIVVHVLIANVAQFAPTKSLLDFGTDGVWGQFETNVKSQLLFAEKLKAQKDDAQKFIVYVSTIAAHFIDHPGVITRPTYTLSKLSGTLLFQLIAETMPSDKIQIVSYNPGLIFNDEWASIGMAPEQFDNMDLAGGFAVWATTKAAAFLHGRFVWASWDVEELSTGPIRRRIDEDNYYLKTSIIGVRDDHTQ